VAETYAGHNFLRFQAGTASGVHFLAALQLASRCGSLVGHFASGATRLFYSAMCLQHAAPGLGSEGVVQGVCPPAYNIRRGPAVAHLTGELGLTQFAYFKFTEPEVPIMRISLLLENEV